MSLSQFPLTRHRHRLLKNYISRHNFSSSTHQGRIPIELANLVAHPTGAERADASLIILHGLFGSKRNWTSLHKAFHRALPHRSIHTLDLRNHGMSPRATPMTYATMAEDVLNYIDSRNLSNVALLGHSMGGKVAMTVALSLVAKRRENILSHLLISDIAPTRGALSDDFVKYINAMQETNALPLGTVRTRTDVDLRLQQYESVAISTLANPLILITLQDLAIRQFLITNLKLPKPSQSQSKPHFNLPLDVLGDAIPELGSFPYDLADPGRPQWKGKTLVFRGLRSSYITDDNEQAFGRFFPCLKVEKMDTGHWVHAEKPNEFKDHVINFITQR
ncbi:mitochondrial protein [Macrolepiota fuliginosa MF-IS2]|uniref:Mitochondrial protein n=1 Tax=Macrolepiota fuliginosa MF-IS2 TaxID=1400762 RepID=A0A9P5XBZ0_9AGAR|nr:mitochondrial protein [Macrolepiota fuliginosa MF-IS2]